LNISVYEADYNARTSYMTDLIEGKKI